MPFVNQTRGVAGSKRLELSIASMTAGYSDTGYDPVNAQDFSSSAGGADRQWYARKFTAVNTGKVQYAQVDLAKEGVPAGTIYACIYSDNGGAPSLPVAQIGDDSDTITNTALTVLPGSATEDFLWGGNEGQDGDGPNIVAGTAYWLVLKTTGYTYQDGVTEVIWVTAPGEAVGEYQGAKYNSVGTVWTTVGADEGANLIIGSSANFSISTDVDGDTIPNEFNLVGVSIKPSVSTVYEMSIFSKSTRLRQDTIYVDPWYSGEAASQVVALDPQPYRFHNRDRDNAVYGSIRIQPTVAASAFEIAVSYT